MLRFRVVLDLLRFRIVLDVLRFGFVRDVLRPHIVPDASGQLATGGHRRRRARLQPGPVSMSAVDTASHGSSRSLLVRIIIEAPYKAACGQKGVSMLDRFFPAGRVLERLRSSDLGVGLDDLAGYLVRCGHSFEVVQEYVRASR